MNLPVDRKSEMCVIGCCLLGASLEAVESLRASDFFHDDTRMAFGVVSHLVSSNIEVCAETMMVRWPEVYPKTKAPFDILGAVDMTPNGAMLDFFGGKIRDMSKRRRMIDAASALFTNAQDLSTPTDKLVSDAEKMLDGESVDRFKSLGGNEFVLATIDDLEARFQRQGAATGILTGLSKFDMLTDGLQRGEQTIIAARPSIGKTAVGIQIMHRACVENGEPTLFVSLEMTPPAIGRRLAACHCEIPMGDLRRGLLKENDFKRLTLFRTKMASLPLHILNAIGGASSNEIAASIRRHVRQYGIRLVIIDYLQKIRPPQRHEKRTYEVGEVSGALRAVAVQCNVAMLTLAQLNRENEKDKVRLPRLTDLADSSQIERDADVVALLHRDRDPQNQEATLIVAKNRDGETGAMTLTFEGQFCKFRST